MNENLSQRKCETNTLEYKANRKKQTKRKRNKQKCLKFLFPVDLPEVLVLSLIYNKKIDRQICISFSFYTDRDTRNFFI